MGTNDIDIGPEASDRGSFIGTPSTYINKENPANGDGWIHTIEIFAKQDITGCVVGTFYLISGNTLKCRGAVIIGNVTAGSKQTFTGHSLPVGDGDYIGMYPATGKIENDTTGFDGRWYKSGNCITAGEENTFTFVDGSAISLYGLGNTHSTRESGHSVAIIRDWINWMIRNKGGRMRADTLAGTRKGIKGRKW